MIGEKEYLEGVLQKFKNFEGFLKGLDDEMIFVFLDRMGLDSSSELSSEIVFDSVFEIEKRIGELS